eukprot:CAMPEP_0173187832 /NCGR_PEP_ID=MMETSP1141-20130122/10928_1 /TAXON_ID=483371 /ORGANISM="non described non described, Strain CCMP2298" /LENGTH=159 /DNA_ID=CAMNT_0014111713 /DNA_START=199 /DNA_END=678 /DNA_ORIENTATION=+
MSAPLKRCGLRCMFVATNAYARCSATSTVTESAGAGAEGEQTCLTTCCTYNALQSARCCELSPPLSGCVTSFCRPASTPAAPPQSSEGGSSAQAEKRASHNAEPAEPAPPTSKGAAPTSAQQRRLHRSIAPSLAFLPALSWSTRSRSRSSSASPPLASS